MGERFRDSTDWPSSWPALVRCPRCDECARAEPAPDGRRSIVRLSCPHCALVREGRSGGIARGELRLGQIDKGLPWRDDRTGAITPWPDAPEQVHPLWLRTPCCGELLWAANQEHLDYLEDFVGADLRERPEAVISPMGRRFVGKGLSWKLPDWMKAAKHRDEVLAAIAKLRATLPPTA